MAAASTIIAGAGLGLSAVGAISNADAQRKALHAQQDAANAANDPTKNGSVDINALDQQARDIARKNAIDSAALENQFNPGASALRANSLAALNGTGSNYLPQSLIDRIAGQAGSAPTGISYDSPLLRDAIAKAQANLTLGGALDRDTQNAVTRKGLATAGTVGGGLNLGRDIVARDLGLTSLDLQRQRLADAAALGGQEAALGQGNAALRLQAQLAGENNLFNSANFLSSLNNGDFSRKLALAQFGQNIAQPTSGLDPSSVVNLAVGNANARAQGLQQSSALQAAQANQKSAFSSGLIGTGLGIASKFFSQPTPQVNAVPNYSTVPYYGYGMNTAPAASSVPYAGWGLS